ncbi:MAG: hypothetical protein A2086_15995 [Spirochaetes bacterium GWD1_27_9]|nr:MAG: hypothetical protein A2Z98_11390 [Spirochaetes bacterium GWB1_27_13]OHD22541.1 MAG: hypothetical protein A2Y34_11020 [Spirochaetes bacterium GWC1_27_15]OHD36217.1 MAG: hypothetical protein A2086_15995 [Spirochaetes bacterium GWD1_27_9]
MIYKLIIFVFLLISIISCKSEYKKMSKNISFEEQYKIFQDLEFKLNEGVTIQDIKRWENDSFLKEPFSLLYVTLGQDIEREPWTHITNKVWYFDTECIVENGDYVNILKRIQIMSNNQLLFINLKDEINIFKKTANVSFVLNNKEYNIKLKVKDDWVDERLFSELVKIISKNNLNGNLTYFNTGDQCCVIGWATEKELNEIRSKTGLKVEWLK